MSETLDPVARELDQRQPAEQLLAQAKEQGVELVGPNGLLNQLTNHLCGRRGHPCRGARHSGAVGRRRRGGAKFWLAALTDIK
jgi:hypothetical protein